jgi:predicted nuclease of predicted toxin-antitoxin system
MRFLVEAQLPPALARYLAAGGQEAEHVADIGLGGAKDQAIWEYAARVGAVIVSKDEDFAQRTFFGKGGPPVVWIRLRTRESASFCFGSSRYFHGSPRPWNGVSALSKLRESSQKVFGRTGDHKKTSGKAEPSSPFWAARLPPLWRRALTQSMSMLSMNMAATIMAV